jgi:Flp pilus assembly pilin Flp
MTTSTFDTAHGAEADPADTASLVAASDGPHAAFPATQSDGSGAPEPSAEGAASTPDGDDRPDTGPDAAEPGAPRTGPERSGGTRRTIRRSRRGTAGAARTSGSTGSAADGRGTVRALFRDDSGMSTVEYAIGTVAAAAFAAILYAVVSGDTILGALTGIVQRALSTTF